MMHFNYVTDVSDIFHRVKLEQKQHFGEYISFMPRKSESLSQGPVINRNIYIYIYIYIYIISQSKKLFIK